MRWIDGRDVMLGIFLTLLIKLSFMTRVSTYECAKAREILHLEFLPTNYNFSSSSSSLSPSSPPPPPSPSSAPTCRDRYGYAEVSSFRRRSAVMCHLFLFRSSNSRKHLRLLTTNNLEAFKVGSSVDIKPIQPSMETSTSTRYDLNSNLTINHFNYIHSSGENTNQTTKSTTEKSEEMKEDRERVKDPLNENHFKEVCSDMLRDDCARWKECITSSIECCKRQVDSVCNQEPRKSSNLSKCPTTWDGFSCWQDTNADKKEVQRCPGYIKPTRLSATSVKTCTKEGTWMSINKKEWTNYTDCFDHSDHVKAAYIVISINSISIFILLTAILVYVYFRDLVRQDRVILHVNFFASLLLSSLSHLLWTCLVYMDKLTTNDDASSVAHRNPVWCRLINFMCIYFGGTTYAWMFCEGFHLHRLISNAFVVPKSMAVLYCIGWVFPMLTAITYASARYFVDNERCWMRQDGYYSWIIYIPNTICVALNLIFLLNILRILFYQIQDQPNEPNSFRRGLKAGLMLVPLFGLQMGATAYRPELEGGAKVFSQVVFDLLIHSQGIFVSFIFCFLSGEVLNQVRREASNRCCKGLNTRSHLTMLSSTINSSEGVNESNYNEFEKNNNRKNNPKKRKSISGRRVSIKSILKSSEIVKNPKVSNEDRKNSTNRTPLMQQYGKENKKGGGVVDGKRMDAQKVDVPKLNVEMLEMQNMGASTDKIVE